MKVSFKELTIFKILRAYELKFGPNLGYLSIFSLCPKGCWLHQQNQHIYSYPQHSYKPWGRCCQQWYHLPGLQNWKFFFFFGKFFSLTTYHFCSKWGSNELNHAATGDLKSGRKGMTRGLDWRTYLYYLFRWVPPNCFLNLPYCL